MIPSPQNPEERLVGLISRHQPDLHRYILSLLPNPTLADDVLQETNLILWRKAAEYDPHQPFLPWAFTIALFQVRAARRDASRDRHIFNDQLLDLLARESSSFSQEESSLDQALEHCLRSLPSRQRQLILDRYQPGNSVKNLAAARRQSPTALSLHLLRIRKTLETCISRRLQTSQP